MVKDAFYFIVPLLLLAGVLLLAGWHVFAGLILVLALFVAFFFRNPDREIPSDSDVIVSPADGRVIKLNKEEKGTRLSIFLSVFNVHVTRAPISGSIRRAEHRPGSFRLAWDDRASVDNEHVMFEVRGENRQVLTFSLIAGLVARRIIPWKKIGDMVKRGERIALIRFGSRVDILIPNSCEIKVERGEAVKAGSSVLAVWRKEP